MTRKKVKAEQLFKNCHYYESVFVRYCYWKFKNFNVFCESRKIYEHTF